LSHIACTGCRLSEAIELTPDRIMMETSEIQFRSLKKRKYDMRGNLKLPEYRNVPVSENLIESLDLTFNLQILKKNKKTIDKQLFTKSRNTYWRIVKGVMK
jgi:integrase